MPFGWMGKYLEIDLAKGTAERKATDPGLIDAYLGGKGVAAKILWDRVPPEIEPFSPENVLIFATGPLTGTIAPTGAKCSVLTRSPQTRIISHSSFGGFWPAELKNAGYDYLVIHGKSPSPLYVWINNDEIELRSAAHLWGKDTYETQKLIKEELKTHDAQIACIGPAGENKVCAAAIQHSMEAVAARGVGAIMGDKNLKAIAVRGTKDINIADKSGLIELSNTIVQKSQNVRNIFKNIWVMFDKSVPFQSGFGNWDENPPPGIEKIGGELESFINTYRARERSCYNCPAACRSAISHPKSEELMVLSCEPWVVFISKCKKMDFFFSTKCVHLCNKYGLDVFSTAAIISFCIELYEQGLFPKELVKDLHLEWGNATVVYTLIEQIVRREGLGALFANGVYEAAQTIGNGADEFVCHVKKLELGHHQLYNKLMALTAALSETGCLYKSSSVMPYFLMDAPPEVLEFHLKEGLISEELAKHLNHDYEGNAQLFTHLEHLGNVADLVGLCKFLAGVLPFYPITFGMQAQLVSCVMGKDVDEAGLRQISERIINLIRAYNVRCGIRRKDDTPPEKFFRDPPSSPQRGEILKHDKFDRMLDEVYEIRWWNNNGIPGEKKLEALDLDYVGEDLKRRGVLTA